MEHEPDQSTIEDALEAETVNALRRLFENGASAGAAAHEPSQRAESATLIGEVTDTHHPDAIRRIRVRWGMPDGNVCERWLECIEGLKAHIGDRVVLQAPVNWPEYLICGVFRRAGCGDPIDPVESVAAPAIALSLEPNKCVQVSDADGQPLLQVRASADGPVVTLLNRNVNIEVAGKLRLSAQTLEFEGGRGGIDIRTDADTVVRSRYLRLN